jgi:hypothetical protein
MPLNHYQEKEMKYLVHFILMEFNFNHLFKIPINSNSNLSFVLLNHINHHLKFNLSINMNNSDYL